MKLVMTLLVRDERDIVESNILFHLKRGVDAVVAVDNGSIDGTREILDEMSKSAPIEVFHEPRRNYDQSRWVTNAALYARDRMGADWVLNNDADEFWVGEGGSLKDVISDAGTASILTCPRRNMVVGYDSPEDRPWFERLAYRVSRPINAPKPVDIYEQALPCPFFYRELPPKALVRTADLVSVTQGNHSANYETLASAVEAPIDIFHFPVRSQSQFEKKIVQGGAAYERNTRLTEAIGWHWRRWYRLYREQGINAALKDALPSAAQLSADVQNGVAVEDRSFDSLVARDFKRGRG